MTEAAILQILLLTNDANTHSPQCFPRLSVDSVQCISRNVADILYNSLTSKNTFQEDRRFDILSFLRKWCTNSGKHCRIDNNNYDCLIDAVIGISHAYDQNEEDLQQLKTEWKNSPFDKLSVTGVVIQHCRTLKTINAEKENLLETIMLRDRKRCKTMNLNLNVSKNMELSSRIDKLELLNAQASCERPACEIEHCRNAKPSIESRDQQIKCAYALLNLNKTTNDNTLLLVILKNLKRYESLLASEVEFINYLWQNCDKLNIPLEISMSLLEKFTFVYEGDLIKMCTDALHQSSGSTTLTISEGVGKVIELSSKNQRLHCNIQSLLYELYASSGYDARLSNILTL